MARAEPGGTAGLRPALSSFVGRDQEASELAGLLREHRLVTITGPVLGVRPQGAQPVQQVLAEVLAPRRLLLVLDNCEHVLDEAARLCAELLGDARRALALARQTRYPAGEAQALVVLAALSVSGGGDTGRPEALSWAAQAQRALSAEVPAWLARWCHSILTHVFIEAGELDRARRSCAEGLAECRAIGDLATLTDLLSLGMNLEWLAGRMEEARVYLREAADTTARLGDQTGLRHCIDQCALVCAATDRPAEALTLWAALAADLERAGLTRPVPDDRELRRQASRALPPGQAREATDRGTRMTLTAAVESVVMLTARQDEETSRSAAELTDRERELVTLVAQGHTNAQIAAQLFISIRTVTSHLDRIRDKTGCRRRADLTRLALREGLV